LCLQETKITDEDFPIDVFRNMGYHPVFAGQKSYNGVATLSRVPGIEVIASLPGKVGEQKRLLACTVNGVRVVNVYVPNGDEVGSEKYTYKLSWLKVLGKFLAGELKKHKRLVVLGDCNIAPEPRDVHDPKRWEGRVLFSAPEREALQKLIHLGLTDVFRQFDQPEKSFSWWDYRGGAFHRNHGLRIDLILCSEDLAAQCRGCQIDSDPRRHERPSDHVPVTATFSL